MAEKTKVEQIVGEQRRKVVDLLVSDLQAGYDWVRPWAVGFNPRNPVSNHDYSGGNRLHLAFVVREFGYDDPRFCTAAQAREKGWHVREGEHGHLVEFWKTCYGKSEKEDSDGSIVERRYSFPKLVRFSKVFNFTQIEGAPELELPDQRPDEATSAIVDAFKERWEVPVSERVCNDSAAYCPRRDVIRMPHRAKFKSVDAFARTLFHEAVHSTGHPSRLARIDLFDRDAFGSEGYAKEELVAEIGSIFTATSLGLPIGDADDAHYRQHAAYVQGWIKAIDDDPDVLFRAATKAQKAADMLLDAYRADSASGEELAS